MLDANMPISDPIVKYHAPNELSLRHVAALAFAAAGYGVFPCVVNGKEPATVRGFKDRTTDTAQINAWWGTADYNIGIVPADQGECVVDIDPRNGGNETLATWTERGAELPKTREISTPSGGRHLWFKGDLPPSAGKADHKLGAGLDTRGRGSYVLVPPSYVTETKKGYEGAYSTASNAPVAELPAWIAEAVESKAEPRAARSSIEQDTPIAIAEARRWLALQPAATEGNASDTLYRHAAWLKDLGVSQTTAIDLLAEHNPSYTVDDIAVRVGNAWKHGTNEAGSHTPEPDEAVFAGTAEWLRRERAKAIVAANIDNPAILALASALAPADGDETHTDAAAAAIIAEAERLGLVEGEIEREAPKPIDDPGFRDWDWQVAQTWPVHEWAWHNRFVLGYTQLLTGRAKAGKTTLLANINAHMLAGRPFLGAATRRVPIVMLCAEDTYSSMREKMQELIRAIGADPGCITGMFHMRSLLDDRRPDGSFLVEVSDDGKTVAETAFGREILSSLARFAGAPFLFEVDPIVKIARFNRYSAYSIRALYDWFEGLSQRLPGITPIITDHPSMTALREGRDVGGDVQMEASFPVYSTLRANDWSNGTARQRKMFFEVKGNRFAPEDEVATCYRSRESFLFTTDGAPGNTAQDRMARVYRHVLERLEKGLFTGKTNNSDYGPSEIAHEIDMDEKEVGAAIAELLGARWLEYHPREGNSRGGRAPAHLSRGPQGPSLTKLQEEAPAEVDPW